MTMPPHILKVCPVPQLYTVLYGNDFSFPDLKEIRMSTKTISAIQALLVSGCAAIVSSGVLTDGQVKTWQPVVVALLGVLGALGIHSLRKP